MRMGKTMVKGGLLLLCLTLVGSQLTAFDFSSVENKITDFTLDNGMKFIVLEDRSAPVVSFVLLADVGASDDPKGYGGLAHVFEHLAFKGTEEIGTTNFKAESKALEKLDMAYNEFRAEEKKGQFADSALLAQLKARFEKAQEASDSLVAMNEYPVIVDREGGVGLNAGTGYDQTSYYCSYPSNKVELWFAMESQRFRKPVMRQFYKERDVIMEERRSLVESSPIGRMLEDFLGASYLVHPYGDALGGHMSDLRNIDKPTANAFFNKYYVASNLMVGIVGDVDPAQIRTLAEKYFGMLPKAPEPDRVLTVEPQQAAERRVIIPDKSQPYLLMGYHRPAGTDPDDPVYNALADYLGQGRTSLLYTSLVKQKKLATNVSAFGSFPGSKYACQFGVFVAPAKGISAAECETETLAQIERLKNELIPNEDLDKIKARAKAAFVEQLSSRIGMAQTLTLYQNFYGDWHQLFRSLDKINAITPEDMQRVAKACLTSGNYTVAYIVTTDEQTGGK